jgi:hypothetical protein
MAARHHRRLRWPPHQLTCQRACLQAQVRCDAAADKGCPSFVGLCRRIPASRMYLWTYLLRFGVALCKGGGASRLTGFQIAVLTADTTHVRT